MSVLLAIAVVVGLLWILKRTWTHKADIHERTESHTTMERALNEWLQDPDISRVIAQQGVPQAYQQRLLDAVYRMKESDLEWWMRRILASRVTRRIVAKYMEREHGISADKVRAFLRIYAEAA